MAERATQPGPTIEQQPLTRLDAVVDGEIVSTLYAIPDALDPESLKHLPYFAAEDAHMHFQGRINHKRSLLEGKFPKATVTITELRENTCGPYPEGTPISVFMTPLVTSDSH